LMRLEAVARDADQYRTCFFELLVQVAELAAFDRAARRIVLGVEIHDDGTPFMRGELELPAGSLRYEVGDLLSNHRSLRGHQCVQAAAARSTSARNSRPCRSTVPVRPGTVPGATSQRGSAMGCRLS